MNLDGVAQDSRRATQFGRLISAVQERITRFGATIPEQILNQWYSASGVRFNDFDVARLVSVAERLQALVANR